MDTLLWIVDGVPEGAGRQPVHPRTWCPALDVTGVLITTPSISFSMPSNIFRKSVNRRACGNASKPFAPRS